MITEADLVKTGFQPPSRAWCHLQSIKGTNSTTIPDTEVLGTDLTGKYILISGGNNGIGKEAALAFARWGANLVLACRNPPPHESHPTDVVEECLFEAKKKGKVIECEWWEVDMADLSSVEALGDRWMQSGRVLDILCNNAGTSTGAKVDLATKSGAPLIHTVNYLSHVLLTLKVLPSLARSREPRIVCTTSCMQFLGLYDTLATSHLIDPSVKSSAYANNKLFFQMWITEMQQRFLSNPSLKHITINGLNPGYVNSGIYLNHGKEMREDWAAWVLRQTTSLFAIDCYQGSLAIQHVATSPEAGPNPSTQGVGPPEGLGGGRYFNRIWASDTMPHCLNQQARLQVWQKVDQELNLTQKGLLTELTKR